MKRLLTLLLSIGMITVSAQCDDAFFPFQEGTSFTQTVFDKKGKEQGKTMSEIVVVEGSTATIKNLFYDKKGEEIADGKYEIICEGNIVRLDFNNFIPEEMLNQYGDAEVKVEGDFITIPNDLSEGQSLPDGEGTVTINMSGANAMSIKMDIMIKDRKVEKKESLTTAAGTYETYKISQTTVMKMNMMGMNKTTESGSSSWFAKGVGMVKSENYDKNGNMVGYTLLTAFQN